MRNEGNGSRRGKLGRTEDGVITRLKAVAGVEREERMREAER